jgi:hypothetical protein
VPDPGGPQLGKLLIIVGLGLAGVGVLFMLGDKLGLGRLPGDINIKGKHGSFYFPLVTCIVLSVLATLLFNLLGKK